MNSFLKKAALFNAITLAVCTAQCMNKPDLVKGLDALIQDEVDKKTANLNQDLENLNKQFDELKKTHANEIQQVAAAHATTRQMKTKIEQEKDSLEGEFTKTQGEINNLKHEVADAQKRYDVTAQEKDQTAQEKAQALQKVVSLEKDIVTITASLTKWRTATGISAAAIAATIAYLMRDWFKLSKPENSATPPLFGSNGQESDASTEQQGNTDLEEAIVEAVNVATDLIEEMAESFDQHNAGIADTADKNTPPCPTEFVCAEKDITAA